MLKPKKTAKVTVIKKATPKKPTAKKVTVKKTTKAKMPNFLEVLSKGY
jgi:hypothetical protein